MGMTCEFYRMPNEKILELANQPEQEYSNFLEENFASINGKYHLENETVFSLDKAWDVAQFIIKENDPSEDKILNNIFGKSLSANTHNGYNYLLSEEVNAINQVLQNLTTPKIIKSFNEEEMTAREIYRSNSFHQNFVQEHIEIIKAAFSKATQANEGFIISIG